MQARALAKAAAAATVLIIIALALGALLFGGRERGAPPEAPGPGAAAELAAPAGAAIGPAAEPAFAADPEAATAPGEPALELRGTFVVLDEKGVEHAGEDGEFLILRSLQGEEPLRVVVTAGKWQAGWTAPTLPENLHVMGIQAGGAKARVDDPIPVPAGGDVSIRARWVPAHVTLEVIGKDTGKGLEGITVISETALSRDSTPHDGGFGPEQVLLESAKSPVAIESSPLDARRLEGRTKVWARAPGHSWGSTTIDFDKGGEYLIVLDRGAALEVALVHHTPAREGEAPARIRVRRPPESSDIENVEEIQKALAQLKSIPEAERPLEGEMRSLREIQKRLEKGCAGAVSVNVAPGSGEVTRIDGLVPGSFTVCVELGEWFDDPLVLGSAPVELLAGQTTRVTVTLEERPDPGTPVPLEGTLYVPLAWGEDNVSLDVEPLGMPQVSNNKIETNVQEMPGRPGMHRWSAGKVPPGKYFLILYDFELQHLVEVPPEGILDADIRVGEPVEVRVKVVDAATGEGVKDAEVKWNCALPPEVTSTSLDHADYDDNTGEHVFRAPAGRVAISVGSERHFHIDKTLQLVPGQKPITIVLHRSCGALITMEGSQLADIEELDDKIELKAVGGNGHVVMWQPGYGEGLKLTVDQPGLYEVRMRKLDGFQAVQPARISIPPGEFVEHTIVLQRE